MISEEDKIMMETLYWWGIPTLFRCKNDPDPKNCDIALVGVPHSTGNGTTERDQHLGPRAVRNISAMLRRSHLEFGIDPWKQNKIHDLGDVPFPVLCGTPTKAISQFLGSGSFLHLNKVGIPHQYRVSIIN